MTSQLRNPQKFSEDVLDIIGRTEDGEAVSYVMSEMRGRRWKNLGNISKFESLLESEGFTLRRVYAKGSSNIRATYVTL